MHKILVIDQHALMRKAILEVLEFDGYVVIEAANGADGLRLMRAEQPQLVLCSIQLSVMDGFTVLQTAQSDVDLSQIPIIILTADSRPNTRKRVEELGAAAYHMKPIDAKAMLAIVRHFLG